MAGKMHQLNLTEAGAIQGQGWSRQGGKAHRHVVCIEILLDRDEQER